MQKQYALNKQLTFTQANYSKRRITVVLRIDTPKHVSSESKCKIDTSFDV